MLLTLRHAGRRRVNDRTVRVLIDDEDRGSVTRGSTLELDLPPVTHTLRVENKTDSSDTVEFDLAAGNVSIEFGLSFQDASRTETILNILLRGAVFYFRPLSGTVALSIAQQTRHQGASQSLLRRYLLDGFVRELKVFLMLGVPAAILLGVWLLLR